MYIVQSPLRVSFFGGGTDFSNYYRREGGAVLTTTIDKSIFVTVKRRFDKKLRVGYTRTEMVDSVDQIQHELIREALRLTGTHQGVEITTMGDIPSAGSGLGSSSTVTVGALKALYALQGIEVDPERLALDACHIEIDVLKKPIGIQDQYIASYGGLRYMEFLTSGEVNVEHLAIGEDVLQELNANLMLFYTDMTRQADAILADQVSSVEENLVILREMKHLASAARTDLLKGNLDDFGYMLQYAWRLKKSLAKKISNPVIDDMYEAARKAGAIGGKITGAGGGGFLLLYCPRERQDAVRNALYAFQELPIHFSTNGARVIFKHDPAQEAEEPVRVLEPQRVVSPVPQVLEQEDVEPRKAWDDDTACVNAYLQEIHSALDQLPVADIVDAAKVLDQVRKNGRNVFILGNGGSAANAAHFACDLSKNARVETVPPLRAIALVDNMALLSALANDDGYENVFVEQIVDWVQPGDAVIAISTSGESRNVIKAIEYANHVNATTIGLTGADGGYLGKMVDILLDVKSHEVQQVEDVHLALQHIMTNFVKDMAAKQAKELESRSGLLDRASLMDGMPPSTMPIEHALDPLQALYSLDTFEWIYALNRKFVRENELPALLEHMLIKMVEKVEASSGSLLLLDCIGGRKGGIIYIDGEVHERPETEMMDVFEDGLAGWVYQNQKGAIIRNTDEDHRWLKRDWEGAQQQQRSAICLPIVIEDKVSGVLTLVRKDKDSFDSLHLMLLTMIIHSLSLVQLRSKLAGLEDASVEEG